MTSPPRGSAAPVAGAQSVVGIGHPAELCCIAHGRPASLRREQASEAIILIAPSGHPDSDQHDNRPRPSPSTRNHCTFTSEWRLQRVVNAGPASVRLSCSPLGSTSVAGKPAPTCGKPHPPRGNFMLAGESTQMHLEEDHLLHVEVGLSPSPSHSPHREWPPAQVLLHRALRSIRCHPQLRLPPPRSRASLRRPRPLSSTSVRAAHPLANHPP